MKTPHPAMSCSGIALNGCGLFVLPFVVGGAASMLFETSEVFETGDAMVLLALVFILPPLVVQLLGVVIKVGRERLFLKEAGRLSMAGTLASVHRHMRIVTPRGWMALGTGLWFVVLSLSAKWASLGMVAVLSLLLFYVILGATSFLSTFQVRTFERGLGRGVAGIRRELSPAVVLAGQVAEERVHLSKVPVPAGFTLLVEDPNPPELETESRYAVGAGARSRKVTLSGTFRKTPRGLHRLGPARIWYQDALGFTRVSVASLATAELKVLPRFLPLNILEPPRSRLEAPDVLTKPHRYATEDYFRFKEYSAGDDTRRIHWRLSIRTGRLQVRLPETRETTTRQILLVLDTYLPRGKMLEDAVGMGKILDALVEVWISLADELMDRGDKVTLVAAVDDGRGNIRVERHDCTGESRRWQDLGARARWQGDYDLPRVVGQLVGEVHGVAVSSRFFPPPIEQQGEGGGSFTWVFLPPGDSLGPREPPFWKVWAGGGSSPGLQLFLRLFRLPGPPGSDENSFWRQVTDTRRLHGAYVARARLRRIATRQGAATRKALMTSGATVYILEPGAAGHTLRGVTNGGAPS
jgi:uncharacterized protein (DUF58 family)